MSKNFILSLVGLLALALVSCGTGNTSGQPSGKAPVVEKPVKQTQYVTMPENTAISVTLTDSIDTDVDVTGGDFRAQLSRSIMVDGHTLFADGASAKGTLNKVVESGRLKTPAELNFTLTSIQDGSGRWIDVGTNTILEKKASHTNRQVALIGGGAIVGGIIGKIIDRKGSTEIGAAAGAAAGTGAAAATGKQDIFHGVGTEVTFYTSQSKQIALK
ncbi:MAG: hypothetical protein IPH59_06640 [bacterium]|nr:hypothetical protein [bacterium]